jgi:hypothetical protein
MISTRLTRELVPRAALNRPVTHCIKQRCVVCQTAVTNEPRNAYLALAASVAGWQLFSAAACWALPPQQLQDIQQQIVQDFSERQYYVTGNLTKSLYDINCIFKDPTTNVKGETLPARFASEKVSYIISLQICCALLPFKYCGQQQVKQSGLLMSYLHMQHVLQVLSHIPRLLLPCLTRRFLVLTSYPLI